MRPMLIALACAGVVGCQAAIAAEVPKKPNVLFVVADDLGWKDVGWHGGRNKTPHMDRLVCTGLELDQHYVQPVCTPTRTALLSGRVPSRFGPHSQFPSNLRALPPGTETPASALRSAGYFTAMCGKWHLGSRPEWGPNQYGFSESYGSLTGAADPWGRGYRRGPYEQTWHRNGQRLDESGNTTELIAAQAEAWIRAKREPWFVYVAFHAVHIPVDAPDEYKRMYEGVRFDTDDKRDDSARRFAAFVSQLDAKIGRFVEALDQTGQRDRTLIVFTSDNGGLLKGGNAYVSRVAETPVLSNNDPLRGQKAQLYEGGIRVPAFANWPGVLAPRKVAAPMHATDWFPTLSAAVGWKPPRDLAWDGQNMWPVLAQGAAAASRLIYIPLGEASALRDGDWKLIERRGKKPPRHELFNLAADPGEAKDLAAAEPQKVQAMAATLAKLRQSDVAELPADLKDLPK